MISRRLQFNLQIHKATKNSFKNEIVTETSTETTPKPHGGSDTCKNVTSLPKYGVLLTPKYGQKRVPYTEMRFFFCTHAWLYDLPTRWLTLWGWPPCWQIAWIFLNRVTFGRFCWFLNQSKFRQDGSDVLHCSQPSMFSYFYSIVECVDNIPRELDASYLFTSLAYPTPHSRVLRTSFACFFFQARTL